MLKSANLGLNIFEGPDNVRRINFVENFELLDKTYGELAKNNSEYVRTTGNVNTYLASKDGLTSYYEGLCLKIKIHVDSTNNCTLNVNNLGAKYIKDSYGNIVKNLKKNIPYHVCYNGSDFILLGKGGGGNAQSSHVLEGYTFTNDSGPQTGTLKNNGTKIFTPGRSNIALSGYYADGSYIKGDSNFIPENICDGVSVFGITGKGYTKMYKWNGLKYAHSNDDNDTVFTLKYKNNAVLQFLNDRCDASYLIYFFIINGELSVSYKNSFVKGGYVPTYTNENNTLEIVFENQNMNYMAVSDVNSFSVEYVENAWK